MKIRELFDQQIDRHINGVVKAGQVGESTVWQELDEFVITTELRQHISDLVSVLLEVVDSTDGAADKNGIWVSGFFGSGKSHFIKVLSYLLENSEHEHDGQRRRAVDFFEGKLSDPLLFADLKRLVGASSETVLFNIEDEADHAKYGRQALLQVFLKVLNKKQGYSQDHPHVAHMERYLDSVEKLAEFQEVFEREAGVAWVDERDAWEFHRDEVVVAFQQATGQSKDSAIAWVDHGEGNFGVTAASFAELVRGYLDSQGPDHRIMFLADEVGQFVGRDAHLMLSLQTLTEQLGVICDGRAAVLVTSQEDLDAVLGDLKDRKQHDFSKIQGRFTTRLSLSSANVDEVIQRRLLAKNSSAEAPLSAAYAGKHDILRNQLAFTAAGMTFNQFNDVDDFIACYPFPAYQFKLVQKVFESIRKAGATGTHLAQGERSMLDAFQLAANSVADQQIGALVPFYEIYPSVEGFLDTAVKRTITGAVDNHALQGFDATLLKLLFLIRYVDELPGSVDNLVTLCVDEMDADKLALRVQVESSLNRLESETLIARNADRYFFLTNEERDIGREIKNVRIHDGAEEKKLGQLLFEDVLRDKNKHHYQRTGKDFTLNRSCDGHPHGNQGEGNLEVAFLSPLNEEYPMLSTDEACVLGTTGDNAKVLIRLPGEGTVARELRIYLQLETYVSGRQSSTLADSTRRILRDLSDQNRERRARLVSALKDDLAAADYFVSGTKQTFNGSDGEALGKAIDYLIDNSYPKMSYLAHLHADPRREIQTTLRADDIAALTLEVDTPESNPKAMDAVREYIKLRNSRNEQVVLNELIVHYGKRPYGWPEDESVLIVAKLAVLKEIGLFMDAAALPVGSAYEPMTTNSKQRKVVIREHKIADKKMVTDAQQLGKEMFATMGPTSEDALFEFLKNHATEWDRKLAEYETLASTGDYPGTSEIAQCRETLKAFTRETDSLTFLERFLNAKSELLDVADDYRDLHGFYTNQRHSWDQLRAAQVSFEPNRNRLTQDPTAEPALAQISTILEAKAPYKLLNQAAGLIDTVDKVNIELIEAAKTPARAAIQKRLNDLDSDLDRVEADDQTRQAATLELASLLRRVDIATSIAHIQQDEAESKEAFDRALTTIEEQLRSKDVTDPEVTPAIKPHRSLIVRDCYPGTFIESATEMEAFLATLHDQIQAGLDAGDRIQLK